MNKTDRPAVLARQVSKTYRLGNHEISALKNVELRVEKGEYVAIAGTSGSGKTTLLNLLGCLDQPTSGEIFIDGIGVTGLGNFKLSLLRAIKIGYVFQQFNLIPTLSAWENVEYPLILLNEPFSLRREQAREALERVGLGNFLDRRPDQLSGGQRQRVAIARAIVKRPKLVLADEPTASLDRKTAGEVLALMRSLNEAHGITFLISSHDPLVLENVNRVFTLIDGQEAKRVA